MSYLIKFTNDSFYVTKSSYEFLIDCIERDIPFCELIISYDKYMTRRDAKVLVNINSIIYIKECDFE